MCVNPNTVLSCVCALKACFLSERRQLVDFVLGTTPARRIKRRRATPPNLGGEFHSDASRHSGNLIAPAGGSFACTVVNVLNSYDGTNRRTRRILRTAQVESEASLPTHR